MVLLNLVCLVTVMVLAILVTMEVVLVMPLLLLWVFGIPTQTALPVPSPILAHNVLKFAQHHPSSILLKSVLVVVLAMMVFVSAIELVQHSTVVQRVKNLEPVTVPLALLDSGEVVAPINVLAAHRILVMVMVLVMRVLLLHLVNALVIMVMVELLATSLALLLFRLQHKTKLATTRVLVVH